jgi:predicted dehydrogenase
MNKHISRRRFLRNSSFAATAFWIGSSGFAKNSPNEKLNIAVIGTANRAKGNIDGVKNQNIVAFCDVDDTFLNATSQEFPQAKRYNDFRKMLEQRDIEAVVVCTADHTHAVATAAVLKSGRHAYCEKPLTHTVHEARTIAKIAAANKKLATQMGTQIHATENYRRVVELVESGAIGEVGEVHVWCLKSKPGEMPTEFPAVPKNLHWDLWLGPVKDHPYSPSYHPKNWRTFWDFGGGCLGDMGCHYTDLAFWALKLQAPISVEADGPPAHKIITPGSLHVQYEFARRDKLPPVRLHWYDGGKKPSMVGEGKEAPDWENGVLFIGSKGMLIADYSKHRLLPVDKFKDFHAPAPYIPKSIGHHAEWIEACKTGSPTTCNFAYGSALSETILLGVVAYRTGEKIQWDSKALKVTNTKAADEFLSTTYRSGWSL